MSLLFIFFALPIATILLSIVLQKVLKCPILVAITFFAIYLVVAFGAFLEFLAEALVATIIYTIIAFLVAYFSMIISRITNKLSQNCSSYSCQESNIQNCCCNNNVTNDLLKISYNCGNSRNNDLLTVSSNCNPSSNCMRTQNENVAVNANFTPCQDNPNRGCIRGCYKRR